MSLRGPARPQAPAAAGLLCLVLLSGCLAAFPGDDPGAGKAEALGEDPTPFPEPEDGKASTSGRTTTSGQEEAEKEGEDAGGGEGTVGEAEDGAEGDARGTAEDVTDPEPDSDLDPASSPAWFGLTSGYHEDLRSIWAMESSAVGNRSSRIASGPLVWAASEPAQVRMGVPQQEVSVTLAASPPDDEVGSPAEVAVGTYDPFEGFSSQGNASTSLGEDMLAGQVPVEAHAVEVGKYPAVAISFGGTPMAILGGSSSVVAYSEPAPSAAYPTPEPATLLLTALGLLAVGARARGRL